MNFHTYPHFWPKKAPNRLYWAKVTPNYLVFSICFIALQEFLNLTTSLFCRINKISLLILSNGLIHSLWWVIQIQKVLDAVDYTYDVWDVDYHAADPSYIEVLSHYDVIICYTGDDLVLCLVKMSSLNNINNL